MADAPITTIGIAGFGNMAEPLFKGLRKKNPGIKLLVMEKVAARALVATKKYQARDLTGTPETFFAEADLVVLAIKPADLKDFLEKHRAQLRQRRVFTILAGTPLAQYTAECPDTQFARCMPNLAAAVGKAVSGLSFSANAGESFKAQARFVTEAMGTCLEIPEHLMAGITALSGSGIALVFEFVNALTMGAVRTGIPYAQAYPAALEVLSGAVEVLRKEQVHPAEMVSRVCSPAGTTIEGIHALEDGRFTAVVMNALSAIANKAK